MVKPQEPSLRRTGYGSTSQDGKEIRAGDNPEETEDSLGPVPKENQPGYHPEKEQDKPDPPGER